MIPLVAVVILNYNGKNLLKKFLPSVILHSGDATIVVADNNSSDGSRELVVNHFPTITFIPIPYNLGFCKGYNYALKRVDATYYVLLNSDIEVTPNWITPVISLFQKNKKIGAVQPKILSYHEKNKFEYAGAAGGFIDILGYPFCRGRLFSTIEKDRGQYDNSIPIFWGTGACLFVSAQLFKKINGLDEDFFAHMEEIDLCWRIWRCGYQVMYCGKSSVYHIGGATLPRSSHIKTYYNFRNNMLLLIKNLPPKQLVFKVLIRFVLDWVAAVKFVAEGNFLDGLSVLKSHAYIVRYTLRIYHKRKHVNKIIPFQKINGIYQRSIVVDYFILRKQFYSNLLFRTFSAKSTPKSPKST